MDKIITVKDKQFAESISADEIQQNVKRIADQINRDYQGKEIQFIGVLNGSFMFAADLLKHITIPCNICFIKVSSYEGTVSTGKVKQLIGLNSDIAGKDVIIIEDIVDTGLTMRDVLGQLREKNPASLRLATLIFKPESFRESYKVDYVGFNIPNDFIVGYGLDYDGYGRNLPEIYTVVEK
ncbi:MAG: hypoxanthine phosphoribosyltransferase [Bacteroidales bacterium]|nr:hypoxanthine phosphoribosyltransferase [Bacteroidales bacterium]